MHYNIKKGFKRFTASSDEIHLDLDIFDNPHELRVRLVIKEHLDRPVLLLEHHTDTLVARLILITDQNQMNVLRIYPLWPV